MMTRVEHLLVILMEECGEVIKETAKALRFGLAERWSQHHLTNRERIETEVFQVIAMARMLEEAGALALDPERMAAAEAEKRRKVAEYMGYSEQLGTVQPEAPRHRLPVTRRREGVAEHDHRFHILTGGLRCECGKQVPLREPFTIVGF